MNSKYFFNNMQRYVFVWSFCCRRGNTRHMEAKYRTHVTSYGILMIHFIRIHQKCQRRMSNCSLVLYYGWNRPSLYKIVWRVEFSKFSQQGSSEFSHKKGGADKIRWGCCKKGVGITN